MFKPENYNQFRREFEKFLNTQVNCLDGFQNKYYMLSFTKKRKASNRDFYFSRLQRTIIDDLLTNTKSDDSFPSIIRSISDAKKQVENYFLSYPLGILNNIFYQQLNFFYQLGMQLMEKTIKSLSMPLFNLLEGKLKESKSNLEFYPDKQPVQRSKTLHSMAVMESNHESMKKYLARQAYAQYVLENFIFPFVSRKYTAYFFQTIADSVPINKQLQNESHTLKQVEKMLEAFSLTNQHINLILDRFHFSGYQSCLEFLIHDLEQYEFILPENFRETRYYFYQNSNQYELEEGGSCDPVPNQLKIVAETYCKNFVLFKSVAVSLASLQIGFLSTLVIEQDGNDPRVVALEYDIVLPEIKDNQQPGFLRRQVNKQQQSIDQNPVELQTIDPEGPETQYSYDDIREFLDNFFVNMGALRIAKDSEHSVVKRI